MPLDDRSQISISIIIPVYNGEEYLAEAIQSVRTQGVGPLEFIVVDDGSTDRTRQLVESFGPECRYHYQDNAGPAVARNAGLQKARGGIIGFLDADDLLTPEGLSVRYARLAESPKLDAVMGTLQVLERQTGDAEKDRFEPRGEPLVCYNMGSVLVRRAVFDRIGAFNPRYRWCEDVDWFMRAQEHGTVFDVLADVVLLYRRHEKNMTRNAAGVAFSLTKVFKASIDRRRKLAGGEAAALDEIYYVRPGRFAV